MGIFIVRFSKKMNVAGNEVVIPLEPEFQSFSEVELKSFMPNYKVQGIEVEVLHDGPAYLKEQKEIAIAAAEAEAKAKKDEADKIADEAAKVAAAEVEKKGKKVESAEQVETKPTKEVIQ